MPYSFLTRPKAVGGVVSTGSLEGLSDVACLLNRELRITYCNPAWDRFALANHGERATAESVLGSSIMDFVPIPLIEFYTAAFDSARSNVVEFDYECSSPTTFRSFRMQILPIGHLKSYAVIHSLKIDETATERRQAFVFGREYLNDAGLVTVCSHCRRSRRADAPAIWDWVPAILEPVHKNVSHGLCPVCHEYFYRHMLPASELESHRHSAA